MTLYDDALLTLTQWTARNTQQQELQSLYLEYLRHHPEGVSRTCVPAHLTASTLVVSADRERVMLHHHAKYGRWLQFGGHLEAGDQTLSAGALREAVEESGVESVQLVAQAPVQLDRHAVRCGPLHPSTTTFAMWLWRLTGLRSVSAQSLWTFAGSHAVPCLQPWIQDCASWSTGLWRCEAGGHGASDGLGPHATAWDRMRRPGHQRGLQGGTSARLPLADADPTGRPHRFRRR